MRYYSSVAQPMQLTANLSSSAVSMSVSTVAGLPASTPFTLVIDRGSASEEIVTVTLVAGTTLTITRGEDGTSAQSHTAGALVRHMVTARDVREPQQHIDATTGVHGLSPGVGLVGTSQTQTLTNKTISGTNNVVTGLSGSSLNPGAVGSDRIATGGVATANLADNAVTTGKIANANVTTAKLADANVTTAKLADNAVTSAKLAAGAVDATALGSGAVTNTKLASDAVTNSKIADGSVSNAKITALDAAKLTGTVAEARLPSTWNGVTMDAATTTLSSGSNWSGSATLIRRNGSTWFNVALVRTGGSVSAGTELTPLTAIPSAYRPGVSRWRATPIVGDVSQGRIDFDGSDGTIYFRGLTVANGETVFISTCWPN